MTKRVHRAILSVAVLTLAIGGGSVFFAVSEYLSSVQRENLRLETGIAAEGVAAAGVPFLEKLDRKNLRITLVRPDGSVAFDNLALPREMENHAAREEIAAARATGSGESERHSPTRLENFFYCARLLPDGSVLRLSRSASGEFALALKFIPSLAAALLAAFAAAIAASFRTVRKIVEPLRNLNLDSPLDNQTYPEIVPVLRRLHEQILRVSRRDAALARQKEEFDAVTLAMREALVLYSPSGDILTLNRAASRLFPRAAPGDHLIDLDRSEPFRNLIDAALSGSPAETNLAIGASTYRVTAGPILRNGACAGGTIVFFDDSARLQAEQLRREFTANVSHELKTPIQSISGSAELLLNNLVKPEDLHAFYSRIHSESQRMHQLVADILSLSRLDEHAPSRPPRRFDAAEMARRILEARRPQAACANVALSTAGASPCPVTTVPELLETILSNLCDNAIRYNRPGGSVTVRLTPTPSTVEIAVEDTGPGIPPEHLHRVFERFYRVDKSRSRATGGTGLGLSIVKHAAETLNAQITLSSPPGKGLTATLSLPNP